MHAIQRIAFTAGEFNTDAKKVPFQDGLGRSHRSVSGSFHVNSVALVKIGLGEIRRVNGYAIERGREVHQGSYFRLNSTSIICQCGTGLPPFKAGENFIRLAALTASRVSPCGSPKMTM